MLEQRLHGGFRLPAGLYDLPLAMLSTPCCLQVVNKTKNDYGVLISRVNPVKLHTD
jgi:hypothetical protein